MAGHDGRDGARPARRPRPVPAPRAQGAPRKPEPPRRWKKQPRKVYIRRRWTAVALIVLFIILFIRFCVPSEQDKQLEQWRQWEQEAKQYREDFSQPAQTVEVSKPLEFAFPSVGTRGTFSPEPCRFEDGRILPPVPGEACIYIADDRPYALPGTDAHDIVVLAGSEVFASLYNADQKAQTIIPGDELYLRTEVSGDNWLKYQAVDLHDASAGNLGGAPEIWGEGPVPGRLLTITVVPGDPAASPDNGAPIIGWQLMGVAAGDQVNAFFPGS